MTCVHKLFIHIAFLNSDLEEEIYMVQPKECIVSWQENEVGKFIKSLYGLKWVPKQWNEKFDQILISDGFSSIEVDKCVYIKVLNN